MKKSKQRTTHGAKAKRGFAVLDRDAALIAGAGAVGLLRQLSTYATSSAAWRCGLGYALEAVETELNDILRFSTAKRLPEELFANACGQPVLDLGPARKDAAAAVKVLRKISKDARADLSVEENQCNQLDDALDQAEVKLNELLPPPGAPPRAKLPFDDDEDGTVPTAVTEVCR